MEIPDDEIGLVCPSERSLARYRLYTEADLERLQQVVVYRRLGFPLDEIVRLLAEVTPAGVTDHLRRQRAALLARMAELRDLVVAIDRALEKGMTGINLTQEERRELFGDGFSDEYAAEAKERWGDTQGYQRWAVRAPSYSRADWEQIKAEGDAVNAGYAAAQDCGAPADSVAAMDAAEAHRAYMSARFYDVSHEMHCGLGQMYVCDARFTTYYEDLAPGLAQYVHDAILANAARCAS